MKYQDGCNTLQDLIINNKCITDRGSTFIYADDKNVFLSYKELYDKALFILGQFQDKGCLCQVKGGNFIFYFISIILQYIFSLHLFKFIAYL